MGGGVKQETRGFHPDPLPLTPSRKREGEPQIFTREGYTYLASWLNAEAATGADGPWAEKSAFYREEAEAALERAWPLVAGEFDTDASDLVSPEEAVQTADDLGAMPSFVMERA